MPISFGNKKVVLPKSLAGKVKSRPEYAATEKGEAIINPNDSYFQESIKTLRDRNQTIPALRKLGEENGNFSSALFNIVQIANSGIKIECFDTNTHNFSQNGLEVVQSVIASMDTLYDYTKKFNDKRSLKATIETLLREVALTSGCGLELVLDQARLPDKPVPVNYGKLEWISNGEGGRYPRQKVTGGDPIDLNISTFWVGELHKEADKAYATPMMKAALKMLYYYDEFIEEMRRTVRKSGHGRLTVSLDAEKVRAAAAPDVQRDPVRLAEHMNSVKEGVEQALSDLEPEDSVVAYDSATFDTQGVVGHKSDYSPMLKQLSGMTATSMKTQPSVIGMRMDGSQSLSNTESLVYLKTAASIQGPVEEVLSRMFTLSARLLGQDVYVKVSFAAINLRPETELESFVTMKTSRILGLLSDGLLTDEMAFSKLDIPFIPGLKLSGSNFFRTVENSGEDPTLKSTPQGRALQPDNDVPRKGGGDSQ